ncbi:unnamed protein product [Lupinus luteus]|uniref:C2H2-type domain-containing protein n=1 Tax=Lupinus luteus TaxID=3873 RepID=A0AAV1XSA1_LUPLU
MEKHKGKLCFRNFSNGKALGGHMRSHMMNLHIHPKPNKSLLSPSISTIGLGFEAESTSSPSSYSFEYNKVLNYKLRENPKRNFRLSDPEFVDTDYIILQDRESKTESFRNPTRRRSKRSWKLGFINQQQFSKKIKFSIHSQKKESSSSISEIITEEDVAFCLMMLSRDKWKRQQQFYEEEEEKEEENEGEESYESEEEMKSSKTTTTMMMVQGQALGGHKRTHVIDSSANRVTATVTATPIPNFPKFVDSLMDLNLPAPMDDDEIEDTAVSDAEFIKSH